MLDKSIIDGGHGPNPFVVNELIGPTVIYLLDHIKTFQVGFKLLLVTVSDDDWSYEDEHKITSLERSMFHHLVT